METKKMKKKQDNTLVKHELSHGERFTNVVLKQFSSNGMDIKLTNFQKKLSQNYFIAIDLTLKAAEIKRLKKSEQYRSAISFTWANVNMNKLAIDVIAYSSIGLDPMQKNHVNLIPYANSSTKKLDFGFIIGYKGSEIKAKKYGIDVPDDIIIHIVKQNDTFKEIKKDFNHEIETYIFEIDNPFDRGNIIGGFYYYLFKNSPEKNKIKVFSMSDILKRKPQHASAEFWGGEKDEWKNGQKTGEKIKIEGWYEEMCYKTIYRAAYGAITIDSEKIDEHYLSVAQKDRDFVKDNVNQEIIENSNKEEITIDVDAVEVDAVEGKEIAVKDGETADEYSERIKVLKEDAKKIMKERPQENVEENANEFNEQAQETVEKKDNKELKETPKLDITPIRQPIIDKDGQTSIDDSPNASELKPRGPGF